MASLPRTLASVPLKVAQGVGRALRDPLKPVREVRDIWNAPNIEEPEEFGEMTLGEHLDELRSRLVKSCYAFAPSFIIGVLLAGPLLRYMAKAAKVEDGFQVLNPTDGFTTYMKMGLYIGFAIAFPVIFYQLFSFIAPGMTRKEKRYVLMSLPFATIMFLLGVCFAFFIAAPRAFDFLSKFGGSIFKWELVAEQTITFYLTLMLGMGLAFELPLVMFMLAKLRIVSAKKQRSLWRFAIIAIMIAAAIITPTPDPFNMSIVAAPLFILYGFGLFLAGRVPEKNKDGTPEMKPAG